MILMESGSSSVMQQLQYDVRLDVAKALRHASNSDVRYLVEDHVRYGVLENTVDVTNEVRRIVEGEFRVLYWAPLPS